MANPMRKVQRIDFIDFSKGFAIIGIVLYHYFNRSATGIMANAIAIGGTGVHLFFLISGFGLVLSSYSSSVFLFYKRRFAKILIPYYLFVTFLFIFNQFVILYPDTGLYAYMGHIFFYKMFDADIFHSFGPYWFISTIIQFYLMFPFLSVAKDKVGAISFLFLSILVSFISWCYCLNYGDKSLNIGVLQNQSIIYLWEFSIGMVLADLYKQKQYEFWNQKIIWMLPIAIAGISIMAVMALKLGWVGKTLNDIPAAAGYLAITIISYSLLKNTQSPLMKIFSFIGNVSYELFLVHKFVVSLYQKIVYDSFVRNLSYLEGLVLLPIAILLALIFKKLSSLVTRAFKAGKGDKITFSII